MASTAQNEDKPKRSRSIEDLASKSHSMEGPFDVSSKESGWSGAAKVIASAVDKSSGGREAQKARNFWHKEESTGKVAKTVEPREGVKKKASRKKEERAPASSGSKPPLPAGAKEKKKLVAAAEMPSSPQQVAKLRDKTAEVSPSAKAIKGSPAASPDLHEDSKKKKKKHSLFGGKSRSRSESPERLPKTSKKASSSKDVVAGHPLETASSMKSLDRESASVTEESGSAGTNVLDIIRQYDRKDELAKSQSRMGHEKTAGASSEPTTPLGKSTKRKADSSKKEATGGKGKGQKDREKDKQAKEDKKKETKEASSSRGLLSKFFKRGKTHEEDETTDKHQKKQAKKDKEKEREGKRTASKDSKTDNKQQEQHHQLTIKGRIERLKESGVYTDGSEDTDSAPVVLVSVTKHEEESDIITDSQSAELADEGRDGSPEVKEGGQMGRVEADETDPMTKKEEDDEIHIKETDPVEELEGGGIELEESEAQDTVDRVKRLQSIFQSYAAVPEKRSRVGRSYSTSDANRSKEIDLSDLLASRERKNAKEAAHPLWLARIIQRLNKCLEKLRKENDVMVATTALVILNTIFSNVQNHPDDDVYRRVRVSSDRFHSKVWQYSHARQFLARTGWVEIDDFIVLPIDTKVDIPKRILDKHLNIANQMLWSMQLELPDSPGVVNKHRVPRQRSLTLMKRNSYATRIVEESLEQIEQDKQAMAAAAMTRKKESESSPSFSRLQGEGKETAKVEKEDVMQDDFDSQFVPESRMEEFQTMKAASAARSIWLQREINKGETVHERKYRLILETELYDLPQPPTTDKPRDSRSRSKSPEDRSVSFVVGGCGEPPSNDKQASKSCDTQVETLVKVTQDENERGVRMENGNGTTTTDPTVVKDELEKPLANKSTSLTQQSNDEKQVSATESCRVHVQEEEEEVSNDDGESLGQTLAISEADQDGTEPLIDETVPAPAALSGALEEEEDTKGATLPALVTTTTSESTRMKGVDKITKKVDETSSQGGDQLRQLMLNTTNQGASAAAAAAGVSSDGGGGGSVRSTSPSLITGSSSFLLPGDGSSGDGGRERESSSPVPQEPKRSTADVQHPTESAIKTGRMEYEKVAIQAAAETRHKWKQTEQASLSSKKEVAS